MQVMLRGGRWGWMKKALNLSSESKMTQKFLAWARGLFLENLILFPSQH